MINKQNLWFLTLFSLILILGVYYITIPNEVLENINIKANETIEPVVEEVIEENSLTAMRVTLENSRREKIEGLQQQLTSNNLTTEEKNNTYEELKYINELQGIEENYEKKLKKEYGLDCFTKIDSTDINVICISDTHDVELANKIMRTIQSSYKNKMNITVKFQKK